MQFKILYHEVSSNIPTLLDLANGKTSGSFQCSVINFSRKAGTERGVEDNLCAFSFFQLLEIMGVEKSYDGLIWNM